MQVAVIEFARNVVGWKDDDSTEFTLDTQHPVIGLITEWITAEGKIETRDTNSDLGGTMRLGGQVCHLEPNTKAIASYGAEKIIERHRDRYEVHNQFIGALEQAGLIISGRSEDKALVEMIELPDHPWFVACQFHPEFTSTPRDGHPLFTEFVNAALAHKAERKSTGAAVWHQVTWI